MHPFIISSMWYFYVLQSKKKPDWFYKGSTGDLKKRLSQHNRGEMSSTKPYMPLQVVYYEAYLHEKAAREREKNVKLSGSVSVPLMKRIKKSPDNLL